MTTQGVLPMQCAVLDHRTGSQLTSVYLTYPGQARYTRDRYRLRLCLRHGRQVLGGLYRRAVDEVTEDQEPEFCLGCAEPTEACAIEVAFYEGDWSARFAACVCAACEASPTSVVNLGSVTAEKLPPRENTTPRGSSKNGRK